jgi:hypothetical protein
MNMKFTVRLVGYSLIAVWCIWLIGRPGEHDPEVSSASYTPSGQSIAETSEEPPPLVEPENAKAVRTYIDRKVSTDDGIDRLIEYARQSPDDSAWSTPVRSAINDVISVTEREQFETGELYAECSGLLCFVRGDMNVKTTLAQLPLSLWTASNRGEISFATATGQESPKYGWVFFVAAPDFEIPADL